MTTTPEIITTTLEWVSADHRMPEEAGFYLVTVDGYREGWLEMKYLVGDDVYDDGFYEPDWCAYTLPTLETVTRWARVVTPGEDA